MRGTYLLISGLVLVVDQISKAAILARVSPETGVPVIPGLFQLVQVKNRGIAFGLFADSSSPLTFGFMILLAAAALGLVGYLLFKSKPSSRLAGIGLALILGGAFGNLLDRVARGHVVDFLDVYVGPYHWPAFNVADSAIVIGAGMLLLDLFVVPQARLGSEKAAHGNR